MSIVLKSDETNFIVYKYLTEMGLNHTAFSMFHEANLEGPCRQYRLDIQPGYLVTLLQKALLLTQIQSHLYLNEYQECNQPTHLLKAHNCQVVQKVIELKKNYESQLNENIMESIKRTNDVYSNQLRNDVYKPISNEAKVTDFLDRFPKVKLRKVNQSSSQRIEPRELTYCPETSILTFSEPEENRVVFIEYEAGIFNAISIVPSFADGMITSVRSILQGIQYTVICFQGNKVVVLDEHYSLKSMFQLPTENGQIQQITENKSYPNIVCLQLESEAHILNLDNVGAGQKISSKIFKWRYNDQYVVYDENSLECRDLEGTALNTFQLSESLQDFALSQRKQYMVTVGTNNIVRVWTFLRDQCIMIFEEDSKVSQAFWITSKNVNYLVILTETVLRIWDPQLTSFKREVVLPKRISEMTVVYEGNDIESRCYLIALVEDSLVVYDITQNRDETVALENQDETMNGQDTMNNNFYDEPHIKQLSNLYTGLLNNGSLYMLDAHLLKDLYQ